MESGQFESERSAGGLVRPTTSASPELWHEILERLREVQESQAKLADAIEVLGFMVQDALDSAPQPDFGADGISWEPAAVGPSGDPNATPTPTTKTGTADTIPPESFQEHVEEVGIGFKDSGGRADSDITGVEASAQRAWSGAAEVPEPAVETGVPEPVFYVPSFDEEVLPATSVAELTPSALDSVLESEFGPRPETATRAAAMGGTLASPGEAASTTSEPANAAGPAATIPHADTRQLMQPALERAVPDSGPHRMAPTAEHNKVLDILLGTPRMTEATQSHSDTSLMSSATASNTIAPPPPAPVPGSTRVMAHPPPPPPPPPPPLVPLAPPAPSAPVFAEETPASSPVFTSGPGVFRADNDGSVPPTTAPEATPDTSSSTFVIEELSPPRPQSALPPPPPAPPSASPSAAVESPTTQSNGSEPLSSFGEQEEEEEEAVFVTDVPEFTAASMATEILSASPEIPIMAVPEESETELISKDVTLIARGRRKRFRLH